MHFSVPSKPPSRQVRVQSIVHMLPDWQPLGLRATSVPAPASPPPLPPVPPSCCPLDPPVPGDPPVPTVPPLPPDPPVPLPSPLPAVASWFEELLLSEPQPLAARATVSAAQAASEVSRAIRVMGPPRKMGCRIGPRPRKFVKVRETRRKDSPPDGPCACMTGEQ